MPVVSSMAVSLPPPPIVFYFWPSDLYGSNNSNNEWETSTAFAGVQGDGTNHAQCCAQPDCFYINFATGIIIAAVLEIQGINGLCGAMVIGTV